jgi:hypothetical protein
VNQITSVAEAIVRVLQRHPKFETYQSIAEVYWRVKPMPIDSDQWLATVYFPARNEIKDHLDIYNWLTHIDTTEFGPRFNADHLYERAWEQALFFLARGEYRSMLLPSHERAS